MPAAPNTKVPGGSWSNIRNVAPLIAWEVLPSSLACVGCHPVSDPEREVVGTHLCTDSDMTQCFARFPMLLSRRNTHAQCQGLKKQAHLQYLLCCHSTVRAISSCCVVITYVMPEALHPSFLEICCCIEVDLAAWFHQRTLSALSSHGGRSQPWPRLYLHARMRLTVTTLVRLDLCSRIVDWLSPHHGISGRTFHLVARISTEPDIAACPAFYAVACSQPSFAPSASPSPFAKAVIMITAATASEVPLARLATSFAQGPRR